MAPLRKNNNTQLLSLHCTVSSWVKNPVLCSAHWPADGVGHSAMFAVRGGGGRGAAARGGGGKAVQELPRVEFFLR